MHRICRSRQMTTAQMLPWMLLYKACTQITTGGQTEPPKPQRVSFSHVSPFIVSNGTYSLTRQEEQHKSSPLQLVKYSATGRTLIQKCRGTTTFLLSSFIQTAEFKIKKKVKAMQRLTWSCYTKVVATAWKNTSMETPNSNTKCKAHISAAFKACFYLNESKKTEI